MKRYWSWPIAIYLFLGGLGGAILTFAAIFEFFLGGAGSDMFLPVCIAVFALALGCFFLVFELGQPAVFLRVFIASKAIIKWGAVLLSIALIAAFIYVISFIFGPLVDVLSSFRQVLLAISGIAGLCIMLYTGILLASLKAHSFWASPALPVLFTVSALSTGAAATMLCLYFNPFDFGLEQVLMDAKQKSGLLHNMDIVLVVVELIVLFTYVLLMKGAGTRNAQRIADKWLKGEYSIAFWLGMVVVGLALPLVLNLIPGAHALSLVASVLVLCGGLLLRFLVVWSNGRALIPGEREYKNRLPEKDEAFITAWQNIENLY